MKKLLLSLLMCAAFVGLAIAQDDEAPLVMPGTETPVAHSSQDDGECFVFARYVVRTVASDDGGANVTVYKAAVHKGNSCQTAGERVLYVEDSDNNAFYGISGKFLFIDKGTSAGSRDLDIYDLSAGTLASSISYNGDLQLIDRHIVQYDAPSDKKGLLRDCKDAAEWKRQGGGVGWVRQKRFDLDTQKAVNVGTLRCVYVE